MKSLLLLAALLPAFAIPPVEEGNPILNDTVSYMDFEASTITCTNLGEGHGLDQYLYEVTIKNTGDLWINIPDSSFVSSNTNQSNYLDYLKMYPKDHISTLIGPGKSQILYTFTNYDNHKDTTLDIYAQSYNYVLTDLQATNIKYEDGQLMMDTYNLEIFQNRFKEVDKYAVSFDYDGKQIDLKMNSTFIIANNYEYKATTLKETIDTQIDVSKISNVRVHLCRVNSSILFIFGLSIGILTLFGIISGIFTIIGILVGLIVLICILCKKKK